MNCIYCVLIARLVENKNITVEFFVHDSDFLQPWNAPARRAVGATAVTTAKTKYICNLSAISFILNGAHNRRREAVLVMYALR